MWHVFGTPINMKKQVWLIALLVAFTGFNSKAQVSVNINIGTQPVWGPVGYDYVEYYYMPDIDAYYDVPRQQYVYYDNNVWITRRSLPPRYSNYNLYNGYKVVINEPRPWKQHDRYRTQYVQYKGRGGQQAIRDSRDTRYYANPRHPHHKEWKGNRSNGNGNSRGGGNIRTGGNPQRANGNVRQGSDQRGGGNPNAGNGARQGSGGDQRGNGGQRVNGNGGGKGGGDRGNGGGNGKNK
jgi:hypothetical protein